MLKPLVLAIQISLCTSAVLSATQAIANTNTYQHYQIQPTTLRQALNAFALQTGINISMNSDQLQNIPSQGLSGQYTLEQGFAELLKNTDFQAQRSGDGFVLVEKPKMQQSQTRDMGQLKTIDVIANGTNTKSNAMQLPTIAVTAENEKSYTVNKIQVGTKMEQELKESESKYRPLIGFRKGGSDPVI